MSSFCKIRITQGRMDGKTDGNTDKILKYT